MNRVDLVPVPNLQITEDSDIQADPSNDEKYILDAGDEDPRPSPRPRTLMLTAPDTGALELRVFVVNGTSYE